MGEGRFAPRDSISREQIAVMYHRALKAVDSNIQTINLNLNFADKDQISQWAREAVAYMSNMGIIKGIGENRFGPKGTASREEAIALTLRTYDVYHNRIRGNQATDGNKEKTKLNAVEIGQLADSVVLIYVETIDGKASVGSGFFYDRGKIATNYHVIEGARRITIEYEDGSIYNGRITITGYSKEKDLATLASDDHRTKPLILGDSDKIKRGEKVYVIGSPMGLKNSLTDGIISAIRENDIQINAAVNPGNSGGALFNEYGEVIGIIYAKYRDTDNIAFAIPINSFKALDKSKNLTLEQFINETIKPPAKPTSVRAVYDGANGFYISWDDMKADYYVIYYSKNGGKFQPLKDLMNRNRWYWTKGYCVHNFGYRPGDTVIYAVASVVDGRMSEFSFSNRATIPIVIYH